MKIRVECDYVNQDGNRHHPVTVQLTDRARVIAERQISPDEPLFAVEFCVDTRFAQPYELSVRIF